LRLKFADGRATKEMLCPRFLRKEELAGGELSVEEELEKGKPGLSSSASGVVV